MSVFLLQIKKYISLAHFSLAEHNRIYLNTLVQGTSFEIQNIHA